MSQYERIQKSQHDKGELKSFASVKGRKPAFRMWLILLSALKKENNLQSDKEILKFLQRHGKVETALISEINDIIWIRCKNQQKLFYLEELTNCEYYTTFLVASDIAVKLCKDITATLENSFGDFENKYGLTNFERFKKSSTASNLSLKRKINQRRPEDSSSINTSTDSSLTSAESIDSTKPCTITESSYDINYSNYIKKLVKMYKLVGFKFDENNTNIWFNNQWILCTKYFTEAFDYIQEYNQAQTKMNVNKDTTPPPTEMVAQENLKDKTNIVVPIANNKKRKPVSTSIANDEEPPIANDEEPSSKRVKRNRTPAIFYTPK